MKLNELYKHNTEKPPVFSIEIFPPKATDNKDFNIKKESLFKEIKTLSAIKKPSLVSITYGAGGTTRENSNIIAKDIKENFDFDIVMPHLTCICSDKNYINKYLNEIKGYNIENILALRGDEPKDNLICHKDFNYASELVEYIKQKTDFNLAVAGYPEGHILATSLKDDIKHLKTKIGKGASTIFTQFFFENEKFYKYLEILEKNHIDLPVAAGILPVISYEGLIRMTELSGIKLSKKAFNYFEKYKNSKPDTIKAGIEWASTQVKDLIENKVDGIHFYTLNKAHSVSEILKNVKKF